MNKVYIAMGTNIEPRKKYIDEAISLLRKHDEINVRDISSIYETDPVGYLDQADFLNLVLKLETSLLAKELLDLCQTIEQDLGRERKIKNGPRTIDLDILYFENKTINTERLIVPHPRMHLRAFVLVPFQEIARDLFLEQFQKTVDDLLNSLPDEDLEEVRLWKGE